MEDLPFDTQEHIALCDLLDELGPDAPTLLEGCTANDLAAHIVLRERDHFAGLCIVIDREATRAYVVDERTSAG